MEVTELTAADFTASGWEDVVSGLAEKDYFSMAGALMNRAREEKEAGREREALALEFMAVMMSLGFSPGEPNAPFSEPRVGHGLRIAHLDDIPNNIWEVFKQIYGGVPDPSAKARIADLLWVLKRDHVAAASAVDAYLRAAVLQEDVNDWPHGLEKTERAFRLALSLGEGAGKVGEVISQIEAQIDRVHGEDRLFLTHRLMGLLLECRRGDPRKYSRVAEDLADGAEQQGDFRRARSYWEDAAAWFRRDGDQDNERRCKLRLSNTFVDEAKAAIGEDPPQYMKGTYYVESAIHSYRKVGGCSETIDTLHRQLLEYQQRATEELHAVSTEIDLADAVEHARDRVRGKALGDALFALALMARSPDLAALEKQVRKGLKDHPLQYLFPTNVLNAQGKVVARMPDIMSNDPEEQAKALRARICDHAKFSRGIVASGAINPARQEILQEHVLGIREVLEVVEHSPFIPPGRELLFATGIYRGLVGDLAEAVHILVPQIENALRYVMSQHGIVTSGLDKDGIQEEYDLGRLLEMEDAEKILTRDLAFDLHCVLVCRYGPNYRNRLAHGLIDYSEALSEVAIYIWWLSLHLCLLPMAARGNGTKGGQAT